MTDGDLELRIAWERHLGSSDAATRWRETTLSRYRQAHRHYHDVRHVKWVVRHVGELASDRRLVDLDAVVAAAFFHDAIYDPTATGNEAASARLAAVALGELGWNADRAAAVEAMIIGTSGHEPSGIGLDEAVLFAADLAILAADPAGYSDYVRNVRREYAHVAETAWVTGRSAVLRSFLGRDAIFAPVLELDTWEQRARGNLAAELGDITA